MLFVGAVLPVSGPRTEENIPNCQELSEENISNCQELSEGGYPPRAGGRLPTQGRREVTPTLMCRSGGYTNVDVQVGRLPTWAVLRVTHLGSTEGYPTEVLFTGLPN